MKDYTNIHTYSFAEYTQKEFELLEFIAEEKQLTAYEELHVHDGIEFIYICQGKGVLHVNGQVLSFQEGSLIRLFSFHIHELKPFSNEPVDYIFCRFPLSVLLYLDFDLSKRYNSYSLYNLPPLVDVPLKTREKIHQSFLQIIDEKHQKVLYTNNMILAELTKITLFFERIVQEHEIEKPKQEGAPIWAALQFMHLHFNQDIDSKIVAEKFGFSSSQLNQALYRITGENFMGNLHEIRIRNACAMMPFQELSIAYIHQYVGYSSPASFYRNFKKLKGTTPERYREENLNKESAVSEKADTVWKIVMYVVDHFKESITIYSASQVLFINPNSIKVTLQSNFEINFSQLLSRIRMNHACSLLKATNLKIAYIATYVGYNSLRTFNRHFKEYLGITPLEFRREKTGSLK